MGMNRDDLGGVVLMMALGALLALWFLADSPALEREIVQWKADLVGTRP